MKDGVIFHFENIEDVEDMTDAELGQFFRAWIAYAKDGESPDFADKAMHAAWKPVRRRVDDDNKRYEERCEKNKAAISKRWGNTSDTDVFCEDTKNTNVFCEDTKNTNVKNVSKKNTKDTNTNTNTDSESDTEKKKRESKKRESGRFAPPSLEDVQEYADEMGYQGFDAQLFIDFYQSKNWMVGKNKMVDWRASVRGWNSRHKAEARGHPPRAKGAFFNYAQRDDVDYDEQDRQSDKLFAKMMQGGG